MAEMSEKLLVWSKWKHPLRRNCSHILSIEDDGEGDEEGDLMQIDQIPAALFFDPDEYLNLWTGNTNFYITKSVGDVVTRTPGVCFYRAMGPYRFNIGVGDLFNQQTVKKEISSRLLVEAQDDPLDVYKMTIGDNISVVNEIRQNIKSDYWAIYLFPNGQNKVITAVEVDETFASELALLKTVRENMGGILLTYLDE